jgi:hypothetical protein
MADKTSLKMIGFVFASLTMAVVLVAATLVAKVSAGELAIEQTQLASLTIVAR